MKTTIPFYHLNGEDYKYMYDIKEKTYYIVHPLILNYYNSSSNNIYEDENLYDNILLNGIDDDEKKYYFLKYKFLKANNLFRTKNYQNEFDGILNNFDIENLLKNLNNLVFEVTDSCNLSCSYCGYGEMYYDHDKRNNNFMNINTVKQTLEFLNPYISQSSGPLHIGFYGGEPLLNIKLIKESVSLISQIIKNKKVFFSMTTNGVLIEQNIDFLVKNRFRLLVSIDGNESNNSYRTFISGKNSFNTIIRNLKAVKNKYPNYFEENIEFNTVLHNRNSVEEAHSFLSKEFNKNTNFSPLDDSGINPEKIDQFKSMYNNIYEDLKKSSNIYKLISDRFIKDPNVFRLAVFLKNRIENTGYDTYEDLFQTKPKRRIPGGTCLPFQKKLFVTVSGKILPCERINQDYTLGYIKDDTIEINFEKIAEKYNTYFNNLKKHCYECYNAEACSQCFFQIDDFLNKYTCHGFINEKQFSDTLNQIIKFTEQNPTLLQRIIFEVILK